MFELSLGSTGTHAGVVLAPVSRVHSAPPSHAPPPGLPPPAQPRPCPHLRQAHLDAFRPPALLRALQSLLPRR